MTPNNAVALGAIRGARLPKLEVAVEVMALSRVHRPVELHVLEKHNSLV